MRVKTPAPGEVLRVSAFCERERDVYRVHVHPHGLPEMLDSCFDAHGEAFPVLLDFEELGRQLAGASDACLKHETRLGSVEIQAEGDAAEAVAAWLLNSIASGVRPRS